MVMLELSFPLFENKLFPVKVCNWGESKPLTVLTQVQFGLDGLRGLFQRMI